MRLLTGVLIVLFFDLSHAQQIEWNEREAPASLAKFAATSNGWFAYEVPAHPGIESMCCWAGSIRANKQTACSLQDREHASYGSNSDSPLTKALIIFARVDQGKVAELLTVGEHCKVDAGGEAVDWLGKIPERQSIDWLGTVATQEKTGGRPRAASAALASIAWHKAAYAAQWLETAASDQRSDVAKQAIFWLGNARGAPGLQALHRLLNALAPGERRRQLTFAISQNGLPQAEQMLLDIARDDTDREQREQAWFWLAQEFPQRASSEIPSALARLDAGGEAEQLVFALSQLPDDMATPALLNVAKSELPSDTRRQALFWLAQSDDEQALEALTQLLQ